MAFFMRGKVKITLILILTFFPVIPSAQQRSIISGTIRDSSSLSPIDYVSIGIAEKNVGTVTDDSGRFQLSIPNELFKENLTISRIGYYSKKLSIPDCAKQKNVLIKLVQKVIDIKDVQITGHKIESYTVGNIARTNNVVLAIRSDSGMLGREIGIVIHLHNKPAFIKDFNFHIVGNSPDSIRLRLHMYDFSKKNIGNDLLNENIFFTVSRKNTGDYKLDLSKYSLHPVNDVFLSIETVAVYVSRKPDPAVKLDKYFYNQITISCSLFGPKSFVRKVSLGNWQKVKASPGFWLTYYE